MPGAIIAFDQLRPSTPSYGSPGVARNDLWLSWLVTCRCTTSGNTSFEWEFLDLPPGSAASLADATTANATFTPDLPGSYRIQLTTNGGGPGNVQVLIAAIRYDSSGLLTNRGWRPPAFGEVVGESNFDNQVRGWAEALDFIFNDLLTEGIHTSSIVFVSNGSPATLSSTQQVASCNTGSGSCAVTLPTGPDVGDICIVYDSSGQCSRTTTITVDAGSNTIQDPNIPGWTGVVGMVSLIVPGGVVAWAWDGDEWQVIWANYPTGLDAPQPVRVNNSNSPYVMQPGDFLAFVETTDGFIDVALPFAMSDGERAGVWSILGDISLSPLTITAEGGYHLEDPTNLGTFLSSITMNVKGQKLFWRWDELNTRWAVELAAPLAASGVTSVTASAPLASSGGATPDISVSIASSAHGDLMYFNGTQWTRLPAGTAGTFLETHGAGSDPTWASMTGFSQYLSLAFAANSNFNPPGQYTSTLLNFTTSSSTMYVSGNVNGQAQLTGGLGMVGPGYFFLEYSTDSGVTWLPVDNYTRFSGFPHANITSITDFAASLSFIVTGLPVSHSISVRGRVAVAGGTGTIVLDSLNPGGFTVMN